MKKVLSLILVGVMMLSLVACGNNNNSNDEKDLNNKENNAVINQDNEDMNNVEDSYDEADTSSENDNNLTEEDVEIVGIRENGQLPENKEDLSDAEISHYLNVVVNAAIDLDMETLKEYIDEDIYSSFESIYNDEEYKAMWQKTIGNMIYLKDSRYLVGKNINHIVSMWYTDSWKKNIEMPEEAKYFTREQTKEMYETYYDKAFYIAKELGDYNIELEEGKIRFEIDDIFEDMGYGNIKYDLAPSSWTYEGSGENYAHLLVGEQAENLNLGYDYIYNDGKSFGNLDIFLSESLEDDVDYFKTQTKYDINSDSSIYVEWFNHYYLNSETRKIIQEWKNENVIILRDLSSVTAYIKSNVDETYPYYTFTDEEKEFIRDFELCWEERIFDWYTEDADELEIHFGIVDRMIQDGLLERK